MSRGLWFVAGAGAGLYGAARARRVMDSLSAEGLRARWHGLTHAARLAGEELGQARAERETELRDRLGLPPRPTDPTRVLEAPRPAGAPELLPTDDTRDTA
ncbi:DUF6167 family protein [Nocardioides campestrisoli]|uniref:DUF6167 family protein n=1 Tax=Nocardioides campestrisoli TaxID=2736757 RepID=UPI00163D9406|nr:DUF6167 family protein [Nocardioides campestrisoli]